MKQDQGKDNLFHIKGKYHSDKVEYGDIVMLTSAYSAIEERGTIQEKFLYTTQFVVVEMNGVFPAVDKFYDGSPNVQKIRSRMSNNMMLYDSTTGITLFANSSAIKVIKKNNFFSKMFSLWLRKRHKYINKYD